MKIINMRASIFK